MGNLSRGFLFGAGHQNYLIGPVNFEDFDPDLLPGAGRYHFSGVIGMDGELAVAAVDK